MKLRIVCSSLILAASANAATNLLINGSFENAGTAGTSAFTGWTKTNPDSPEPATVIDYTSALSYPTGIFGGPMTPDNSVSLSPDSVGTFAAYFVGDTATDETISQAVTLAAGNYRFGFSYYLPTSGLANINNASIVATIAGTQVSSTSITGASSGGVWFSVTGIAAVSAAGTYSASLVYNSNGDPAKDVVVDRVYLIATTDTPGTPIPPVPEPSTALLFGLAASSLLLRRRNG